MENVIHWELCKIAKFDHTNKWYMHKIKSVHETETNKVDHPILVWIQNLVLINKKKKNL